MCIRELGENKATLSDSPNKGDLRGLQLTVMSTSPHPCFLGQDIYCRECREWVSYLHRKRPFWPCTRTDFSSSLFNFLLNKKNCRERGKERETERNINLLFHLVIHSLVDSRMCPDWGLNPQPGWVYQDDTQYPTFSQPLIRAGHNHISFNNVIIIFFVHRNTQKSIWKQRI